MTVELSPVTVEVPPGKAELTPHEEASLDAWKKAKEKYKRGDLSPTLVAQLFNLFLAGSTCEEICRLNPGLMLGQIVEARLEHRWDEHKRRYTQDLMAGIRQRVAQVQLEAIVFQADLLAAAHKLHGDRLKKFLMTGNPADLGDLSIESLGGYKQAVELLLKLTGQDATKKVQGEVVHKHEVAGDQPLPGEKFLPKDASKVLEYIQQQKLEKEKKQ